METLLELWNIYGGQVLRVLLEVLALVALTRWGQANRKALHATAEAIERMGGLLPVATKHLKGLVAEEQEELPEDAQAAIQSAVARAEDVVLGLTAKPRTGSGREVVGVVLRLLPVILRAIAKRKGLMVLLLAGGLVAGGCVTTVSPDGTRTTRPDWEAVQNLMPLVEEAAYWAEWYAEAQAQAEARQDARESARLRERLEYWQSILDGRKVALEAISGAPAGE